MSQKTNDIKQEQYNELCHEMKMYYSNLTVEERKILSNKKNSF